MLLWKNSKKKDEEKSEKKDTYLDSGRELKKLRKMKVTVIAIVSGSLGTVTKGLVQEVKD